MDRPTRICRCGYLCRLWAVGGERREYTARGNCGQVARHEVPAVRLAGRCGGPGHAVALSLLVQLRDPGLRDFAMDDRVHRGLLFVRAIGLAASVCRPSPRPPFAVLRMPRPQPRA